MRKSADSPTSIRSFLRNTISTEAGSAWWPANSDAPRNPSIDCKFQGENTIGLKWVLFGGFVNDLLSRHQQQLNCRDEEKYGPKHVCRPLLGSSMITSNLIFLWKEIVKCLRLSLHLTHHNVSNWRFDSNVKRGKCRQHEWQRVFGKQLQTNGLNIFQRPTASECLNMYELVSTRTKHIAQRVKRRCPMYCTQHARKQIWTKIYSM